MDPQTRLRDPDEFNLASRQELTKWIRALGFPDFEPHLPERLPIYRLDDDLFGSQPPSDWLGDPATLIEQVRRPETEPFWFLGLQAHGVTSQRLIHYCFDPPVAFFALFPFGGALIPETADYRLEIENILCASETILDLATKAPAAASLDRRLIVLFWHAAESGFGWTDLSDPDGELPWNTAEPVLGNACLALEEALGDTP